MDATSAELLAELQKEIAQEIADALYVVHDPDEAAALVHCGLDATIAGMPEELLRCARAAAKKGAPVVIVQSTDGAMRDHIHANIPEVEVRDLALPPGVASVAGWLGWDRSVRWSADEAEVKRFVVTEAAALHSKLAYPSADTGAFGFPVGALPNALRELVTQGAEAQGVDVGYYAVPLLGILTGCVGATRTIRVSGNYRDVPCLLWTAVVAPSGSGKSPGLRILLRPVRDHDRRLHERTVALQQTYEADMDRWKATAPHERGDKPVPPAVLAATVDDVTMEALAARLVDNPRGLLVACDELAGWLKGMDKYRSGGGDEQRWQSVYDAGQFTVDRKGAGNGPVRIVVRRPCVSITGTIQPSIARKYLADAERRASGTAARVLMAMPSVAPARLTDKEIAAPVLNQYGAILRGLLDLTFDANGDPFELPLSRAAFERFREWHDRSGDEGAAAVHEGDEQRAAVLAKLRGAAPRIALVLGLSRAAEKGTAALLREIDDADMAGAIAIVDYFSNEAVRIYALWDFDEAGERASRERGTLASLAERLRPILLGGARTMNELHDATGKNYRSDHLRAALRLLGAASEKVRGARGAPREVWSMPAEGTSP